MKTFKEETFKVLATILLTIITFLSGFIFTQSLKIAPIQKEIESLNQSIDAVNAVAYENRERIQDNRERLIFIEAVTPQKKGRGTTKNLQSTNNNYNPLGLIYIDDKEVDNVAWQDIINFNN